MSITAAKLAILADYYGFDLNDARVKIGLPPTKGGRTTCDSKKISSPKPKQHAVKSEKPKRGPTGYHLFLKDYHPVMKAKMQANLKSGEKLSASAVRSAVGAEWKALSDGKRETWNKKAKGV